MWELLLIVIVCGIFAWVLNTIDIPQPFKNIAFGILLIIVVVSFFQLVLGVGVIPLGARR